MRTKTMILSGVIAALSGASLMAQVYSLNAVGYINVSVPTGFSMLADQLYATNQSTAQFISPLLDAQMLDGNHNGVIIYKYSSVNGYTTPIIATGTGWSGPATTTSLNPGEAVFIYNPLPPFTLTFVGQVPQGSLTNTLNQNFNMVSSVVPQSGAVDSVLGLTANAGDIIYLYDPANGFSSYVAVSTLGVISWSPSVPVPAVAQGFFYYTTSAAGVSWSRTFSVN